MDYDKKVISNPNSSNCDFIGKSSSSVVLNSFFNKKGSSGISFLPITFSGLSYVDNLAREKNNDSVVASGFFKSASFTLLKALITVVAVFIFIALIILGFQSIVFVFTEEGSFLSNTVFIILSVSSFISSGFLFSWLQKVDERKALTREDFSYLDNLFSAHQRKELSSIEVVDLQHSVDKKIDSLNDTFLDKVKSVFILDQKTIQHIDLFPFSNKYDEYMRLYCFLAANHDVISEELMRKYIGKLESILDSFSKESDMIVDLAKKYDKDIEKAQLEQKQLKQKMADEDALRVVPVEENDF